MSVSTQLGQVKDYLVSHIISFYNERARDLPPVERIDHYQDMIKLCQMVVNQRQLSGIYILLMTDELASVGIFKEDTSMAEVLESAEVMFPLEKLVG